MKRTKVLRSIPFDLSLRDALGERLRVLPGDCARYPVSGVTPKSVALPRDAKETALALEAATAEGAIVVVRGAGTKSHRQPPPRTVEVVLDTSALDTVVEHAPEDLTVTVGGGTPLVKVEALLRARGQFWPCDAPFAASSTVGGTIASNAHGALRLRYGALREQILGALIATPDGALVRTGARVVKSVAGYDSHKLISGSFGTLGVIAEATLKVAPLPETENVVVARFRSAVSASAIARAVATSPLFPMAIVLVDDACARRVGALLAHASTGSWLLLIRCGGNRRSVARQVSDLTKACEATGADSVDILDHVATPRAWSDIRELSGGAPFDAQRFVVLKTTSLPTDTPAAIADARNRWPAAELSAQPASGIVYAHIPVSDLAPPAGANGEAPHVEPLHRAYTRAGWSAIVLSGPPSSLPPYVTAPSAPTRLFRAVKAALDPAGTLDPGRLPGGV
ncbi:MAG TPA: FAD-binding oxidoreductase [Candidatus Eremiobacteraceae bacterium]|nr:FAD-binding oxidoreductase [Candidatus Eremiobacteraceae bacterium]